MANETASIEKSVKALAHAKDMLKQLFDVMAIKRVFIIDDELSASLDLSDLIGQISAKINKGETDDLVAIAPLSDLKFESDATWRKQVNKLWDELDATGRRALAESVGVQVDAGLDEGGRDILGELLGDYQLRFLSLQQWQEERDALLAAVLELPSLFLFDQDMRKNQGSEMEGMKLIAGILKGRATEPPVYCGLFTNLVTVENEHERHTEFANDFQLTNERDRFTVISKQHIHQEPSSLAIRLKRVAISPWCEKLKVQLVNAVKGAVDDAAEKVGKLDIYDFEQIVFQSSYKEGVWEADTLLRLFGLFHREAARTRAKDDAVLTGAADKVRSVISLPYRPVDRKGTQIRDITRLELYETSEYLISHRMPIDVGDIFQKTGGTKQFILLEQPCDLMVRGDTGKRNTDTVILVELIEQARQAKGTKVRDSFVELEHYASDEAKQCFVNLANCVSIPACIVDLCVFNNHGIAEIKISDTCPAGMMHAWKLRFGIIHEAAKSIINNFRTYTSADAAGSLDAVKKLLQSTMTKSVVGFVKGDIKSTPDRIVYNLKRIGRVRQPRAGSILRQLAYFKARDAFDHDLMRNMGHETSGASSETCQ